MIAVIVIALVAGFITELFFFGGSFSLNPGGSAVSGTKNVTGTVVFNGTIRTYDPVLGIPANTSQTVVLQLRKMPGVRDVKTQANLLLVEVETRDDVYPLAMALRGMNVSALCVANIVLPPEFSVETPSGPVNATSLSPIVRVETEPFVDAGTEVPVAMTAVVSDGILIDYYSARVLVERRSIIANATVAELANMTFTYVIPWDVRSYINLARLNISGQSYTYRKVNTIMLSPQLNVTGVFLKKLLPYVTFIDTGSAEVSPAFSDEAAVRADFQETNVTFPPSTLTVVGNIFSPTRYPELFAPKPNEVALNYTPSSVSFAYVFVLHESAGGYVLGNETSFTIDTRNPLELNSTVPLNVTVLAIGNKVLSVAHSGLAG
jgi:hypothetical protein